MRRSSCYIFCSLVDHPWKQFQNNDTQIPLKFYQMSSNLVNSRCGTATVLLRYCCFKIMVLHSIYLLFGTGWPGTGSLMCPASWSTSCQPAGLAPANVAQQAGTTVVTVSHPQPETFFQTDLLCESDVTTFSLASNSLSCQIPAGAISDHDNLLTVHYV